jgi:outer membrane protein assembly factor BamB
MMRAMKRGRVGVAAWVLVASLGLLAWGPLGGCNNDKGSSANGGAGGNKITSGTGGLAGRGSGGSAGSVGAGGSAATGGSTATVPSGESVLMHHKNLSRDGVYVQPKLTKAAITASFNKDPNFSAVLATGEAIYAQPLFVDGAFGPVAGTPGPDLVIVATEQNNVYALNAATGAQVWKTNLGAPVPLADMPCGNIDPFGVTGTPVIDFGSRALFVDAMTTPDAGTTKRHLIFALSIDDGSIRSGWPLDVGAKVTSGSTTFNNAPQSQRGALAVLNGTLYVAYGGLYGDCVGYHGWLVAVSISDPTQLQAWATSAAAGGVWGPGGVASDGTNLYVTTGNTQSATVWGGGEGLLRFTPGPSFATPAYWAATDWLMLDNGDEDVGGSGPIVFDLAGATPSSLALALGKDGNAYLLDRNNLGGIAAPLVMASVATNEIIGAAAVYTTATATYVAMRANGKLCTSGSGSLSTLKIVPGAPPTIVGGWCAEGGSGAPMVTTSDGHADAIVWILGADGNGFLNAFDGDTGAAIAYPGKAVAIPGLRRYNTPIAAKGRMYVPADGTIVAFTGG